MFIVLPSFKNFPSQVQPNLLHRAANYPTLPFTLHITAILMFLYEHAHMLKICHDEVRD